VRGNVNKHIKVQSVRGQCVGNLCSENRELKPSLLRKRLYIISCGYTHLLYLEKRLYDFVKIGFSLFDLCRYAINRYLPVNQFYK